MSGWRIAQYQTTPGAFHIVRNDPDLLITCKNGWLTEAAATAIRDALNQMAITEVAIGAAPGKGPRGSMPINGLGLVKGPNQKKREREPAPKRLQKPPMIAKPPRTPPPPLPFTSNAANPELVNRSWAWWEKQG